MHTFTSNSTVTLNAVTQETGTIVGEIYNAVVGKAVEGFVSIECSFLNGVDGPSVYHRHFQISEADFNAFEANQTLNSTNSIERFEEVCSLYIISELDGMWGLSPSDWTLNAH